MDVMEESTAEAAKIFLQNKVCNSVGQYILNFWKLVLHCQHYAQPININKASACISIVNDPIPQLNRIMYTCQCFTQLKPCTKLDNYMCVLLACKTIGQTKHSKNQNFKLMYNFRSINIILYMVSSKDLSNIRVQDEVYTMI